MGQIIDGKMLAEKIHDATAAEIFTLGERPNLAIILIGERDDSELYVRLKEKKAKEVGVDTHLYRCVAETPASEILAMIDCLNKDDLIDAILVQLPLPDGFDTDTIISAIDPAKDVDRFHPDNVARLQASCDHSAVLPPLYATVLHMLDAISCSLSGKKALVIGNSDLFRSGLAKTFSCLGAVADTAATDDDSLLEKSRTSDIIVVAVGRPRFVTADMIKEGAILIDIGINSVDGRLLGDVDTEAVLEKASFVSPVPGGVGPMTIAMLFRNTLHLYRERRKNV